MYYKTLYKEYIMFKGYRNHLLNKDTTNKNIASLLKEKIVKCVKCNKLNPILYSPALSNVRICMYCGNPFYVIKDDK
jgi:ribosomal protein S27E